VIRRSAPGRSPVGPVVILAAVLAAVAGVHYLVTGNVHIGWYGTVVGFLLLAKLGASLTNRPAPDTAAAREATARLSSVLVVPLYNEDPVMLTRCLRSLLEQTHPPTAVVVVDDGSRTLDAHDVAVAFAAQMFAAGVDYTVHCFETNRGKRAALAHGFGLHPNVDLVFGVDSDTLLAPQALEQLRLPFADPTVTGATGLVLASNQRRNLLTRLIHLRYAAAFLAERAAYSRVGAVLCCCGSLSAYRGWLVQKYLSDFVSQTFLGQPAVFGDDRRLTNYALLEGRVVFQETAVAWTAVPERVGHFARQQVRWSKSFFRESVWAVRSLPANRPAMWLSLLELTTWVVFTAALLVALVVAPLRTGIAVLAVYGIYVSLLAYARSVRYFQVPTMPGDAHGRGERLAVFALAPAYGLLHLGLVLPLRLWALVTLHRGAWGTRAQVEVSLASPAKRRFVLPQLSPRVALVGASVTGVAVLSSVLLLRHAATGPDQEVVAAAPRYENPAPEIHSVLTPEPERPVRAPGTISSGDAAPGSVVVDLPYTQVAQIAAPKAAPKDAIQGTAPNVPAPTTAASPAPKIEAPDEEPSAPETPDETETPPTSETPPEEPEVGEQPPQDPVGP